MNSTLLLTLRGALLASAAFCLSACSMMVAKERSAYVMICPAGSAPAYEVPPGKTEALIEQLISRRYYQFTRDTRAAWLIYVDERPGANRADPPRYVIREVLRNPNSRFPEEISLSTRELSSNNQQHRSLQMLEQYERAEQSRGH